MSLLFVAAWQKKTVTYEQNRKVTICFTRNIPVGVTLMKYIEVLNCTQHTPWSFILWLPVSTLNVGNHQGSYTRT